MIKESILAELSQQVEAMVKESGDADGFEAARWLAEWIEQRVPALGNARPIDLLSTADGETIVRRTLAQMQSGAYA